MMARIQGTCRWLENAHPAGGGGTAVSVLGKEVPSLCHARPPGARGGAPRLLGSQEMKDTRVPAFRGLPFQGRACMDDDFLPIPP